MNIPPYWARESYCGLDRHGRERCFHAWGWSFESHEAARTAAAARALQRFNAPPRDRLSKDYDYLDRPLREEILERVTHEGRLVALITRNRYGASVLNAASVCFADVDYPSPRSKGFLDGLRLALFPGKRRARAEAEQAAVLCHIRDWAARNQQCAFRLYQTAAGLRLLFTDVLRAPTSRETAQLFDALRCDMLYRRLTLKQECFRARLTPKPWRCACPRPPSRYPWNTEADEHKYRQWEAIYREKTKGCATCRLLEVFGPDAQDPEIAALVDIHDEHACAGGAAPLA